jgi:hypothetical protein
VRAPSAKIHNGITTKFIPADKIKSFRASSPVWHQILAASERYPRSSRMANKKASASESPFQEWGSSLTILDLTIFSAPATAWR